MSILLLETVFITGQTLQLVQGDITVETTDAIVNAANPYLKHGAGVAGAILRAGGPTIQRESDAWVQTHGPVPHAAPAWTSGGELTCRYVIHAVGPVWDDGNEVSPQAQSLADAKLTAAVTGSLGVAETLKLGSISIPAISTGIFGFPRERAAKVILSAVQNYLSTRPSVLKLIRLVLLDRPMVAAFEKVWHDHFGA